MEKWEQCSDYLTLIGTAVPFAQAILDPAYLLKVLEQQYLYPAAAWTLNTIPAVGAWFSVVTCRCSACMNVYTYGAECNNEESIRETHVA